MRLALIRAKYNPFGGAERFVETAVGALAAEGVRLTIVTRQWPAQADRRIGHVLLDPRYITSTGRDRGFADAVCQHVARAGYDLVQSHERLACCDIYRAGDGVHAEWLTQRARIQNPLQRWATRYAPHHRYLLEAERALFRSSRLKAVICNSALVRDDILRHFPDMAGRLHVIHSGVDSDTFSPALRERHGADMRREQRIPTDARVALFVGSGFERKGLGTFLHALVQCHGDVHGVVVGSDKRLARYRRMVERLGIAARVRFAGGVTDVRPWYGMADVFVLPTLYDPLPNACLEAMACGLPVVTSTTSGAAELIETGVHGAVTDALDSDAVARAIETATRSMGEAAHQRVATLTPAAMAAQYVALYRALLGLG